MSLDGYKIVITEDEPDEATYLSTILEDSGASVYHAHNGNQALDLIREHTPDLMTLDLTMPGIDPTEILRHIAESDVNGLKICVISGRPELRGVILDQSPVHIAGYVDKPYTEQTVLEKVKEILAD